MPSRATQNYKKKRAILVEAAGRRMRSGGFAGVGVDAIAAESGVTSGAFYRQFETKNEVLLEVLRAGLDRVRELLIERQKSGDAHWLETWIDHYLSPAHVEDVERGCVLPTLTSEAARVGPMAKALFGEILDDAVTRLANDLTDSPDLSAKQRAWAFYALLAGGVMLARGMPEPAKVDEVLESCRRFAKKMR